MRGSREILAAVVVTLALTVYFLFLRPAPQRPGNQAAGRAGFVTTSKSDGGSPVTADYERRQRPSDAPKSTQLPATSNVRSRRGADERFPARLDLLVIDSKTHLPIRAVRVTATNRASQETVAEQILPEGRGTIDLPNGALYLSFEHPDYQERGLWIEFNSAAGQISQQIISLRREVQVSGMVRDQNGAPVSGATIVFPGRSRRRPAQIVTGTDGRFNCRLAPGTVSGTVFKAKNTATFASVVSENSTESLDITLPITSPTISFTGRVLNQKGEPVEGVDVRIIRPAPSRREFGYAQTTQEDGTFAFSLPPSPDGLVGISGPGFREQLERVPLSTDVERDFVINLQPGFTVTLLTPEGKALTKGFRLEGVGSAAAKILRLRDGRYYSTAYPIDIRAIAAESGYGTSEVAHLSAYEPEVTLRIEPGGNLQGRVVDPSGRPITRFSYLLLQGHNLYLSQSLIDSPDGSFGVRHVARGNYTVNIVADGYRMQGRDIQIESGRDYFIELILQQEASRRFPPDR